MGFRIAILAAAIILLYTIQAKKDRSNDDDNEKKRKEPDLGRTNYYGNHPGRKMHHKSFDYKTSHHRPYYESSSHQQSHKTTDDNEKKKQKTEDRRRKNSFGNHPDYKMNENLFDNNTSRNRSYTPTNRITQGTPETTDLNQEPIKTVSFTAKEHGPGGVEYMVQFDEKGIIRCKVEYVNSKYIISFVGVRTVPGASDQEQPCIPGGLKRTYAAYNDQDAINRCENEYGDWGSFYCRGILEWCGNKDHFFIKRSGTEIPRYNFVESSYSERYGKCSRIIKRNS